MKHSTRQTHHYKQNLFKTPRCLNCQCVLIEGEEQRCRLCAGHFAIYGDKSNKKELAA